MQPHATLSIMLICSLTRHISNFSTSATVRTRACFFSDLLASEASRILKALGDATCSPPATLIPKKCWQKLRASMKPCMAEAGLPLFLKYIKNSSMESGVAGKGAKWKYFSLYHLKNERMLDPLLKMVLALRFPKTIFKLSKSCSWMDFLRSKPLGQLSSEDEKIIYHFSRALSYGLVIDFLLRHANSEIDNFTESPSTSPSRREKRLSMS